MTREPFLRRIISAVIGEPAIQPGERDALLEYLKKEVRMMVLHDSWTNEYNHAYIKYGGVRATPETLAALRRLHEGARQLVRRHLELGPVPDKAARTHAFWQAAYVSYEEWTAARVAEQEGLLEGADPDTDTVDYLRAQHDEARQQAQREQVKLGRRLGLRSDDVRQLILAAKDTQDTAA
jgi:hypothetical protein